MQNLPQSRKKWESHQKQAIIVRKASVLCISLQMDHSYLFPFQTMWSKKCVGVLRKKTKKQVIEKNFIRIWIQKCRECLISLWMLF